MNSVENTVELGRVYWLTGLSGSGKTTIGRLFYEYLKKQNANTVYLDGDILREIFGGQDGYSLEKRKELATSYSRLCNMLSGQGIHVVCATISMFNDVRTWNRKNIQRYTEVYLKVDMDVLIKRDQKQLYSRAIKGEIANVMGVDIQFEEPISPDIVIENNGDQTPTEVLEILIRQIKSE